MKSTVKELEYAKRYYILNRGTRLTKEERQVISIQNGLKNRGKKRSEEVRLKFSAAKKGELHPRHKLTQQEVDSIREVLKKGESVPFLAEKYNVHITTIYKIKNNERWRN